MDSISINAKLVTYKLTANNTRKSFKERCEAILNLNNLPHKDKEQHVTDVLLNLISDENIPILDRYNFFNKKFFSNNIVDKCHKFYFNNFIHSRYPLQLRISSAKYLLSHTPKSEYNSTEVHRFLLNLSRDARQSEAIKYECSSILNTYGLRNFREEREYNHHDEGPIIVHTLRDEDEGPVRVRTLRDETIPENRRRKLIQRRTVYEDNQNVHNTAINESVKESIIKLYTYVISQGGFVYDKGDQENHKKRVSIMNDISMRITSLSKKMTVINKKKVLGSFDRIMTDAGKFKLTESIELTLFDVLLLVWFEIKASKDKEELERCLIEELLNMNGVCTTGHLSRIVNILSGFSEHISIRISYKDQIKNYLFNFYNQQMKNCKDKELLIDEIIEDGEDNKKNLLKFIKDNSVKESLEIEFVKSGLVSQDDFEKFYTSSVKSYCGL